MSKPALERLPLGRFLEALDGDLSADLRRAAADMDRLARQADADGDIERRFLPWAIVAAVLFVIGLVTFFTPGTLGSGPMMLCMAALPGVLAVYAWRIRGRTALDYQISELNKLHFLPNGGIYFPPSDQPAGVVLVDWTPPEEERPLSEAPRDPRKSKDRRDPMW